MNLRHLRAARWLTAFALLITLITVVGSATAAADNDMFDPDVRLSDGFFPSPPGNALIVTSSCAPNGDLNQPSNITVASRSSGSATIPGAPSGGWVNGNLTWQLTANIGAQSNPPVTEFWPFTIDGAPTGSHFLPTGALTSFSGQFQIDRSPFGNYPGGEDIGGTLTLGPSGGWGVCRTYLGEDSGSPTIGPNVTGSVHSLHAGELKYTITQPTDGPLGGETGPAAATLMNSHATGNPPQCPTPCTRISTGHLRLEFGTTIPSGGSQFTDAGGGVAPVSVEPMPDVTIEFTDVTGGGITNVVKTTDAPTLPGGFQVAGDGLFYEIKTTAGVVFPATVCFPTGALPAPQILHFEGGTWVSVPTTVVGDQACGQVNSLSPFAVGTSQIYDVAGPFQPVDPQPTLNTVKAGQAVPVKFSLGGNYGLDVLADGYPKSVGGPCSGGQTDDIETTSNGSGLGYDASTGNYTYHWKTLKAWSGHCRTLTLQFSDGQELKADFKFK